MSPLSVNLITRVLKLFFSAERLTGVIISVSNFMAVSFFPPFVLFPDAYGTGIFFFSAKFKLPIPWQLILFL